MDGTDPRDAGRDDGPFSDASTEEVEDAQRLLTALGARLRAPLTSEQRSSVLETILAPVAPHAAVAEVAPERAAGAGTRPRSGRGGRRDARRGRRRIVLTAGVAALAVIAGSSVALLGGGEDLPLVQLGGGSAAPMGDSGLAAGASRMAESGDAATSMWWTPTRYRFVLADGVGHPAGAGPAWRLVPPADRSAAAARIAAEFGLPVPVAPDWDPEALQSNGEDGSSLWFSSAGDWYFSGAYDESLNWICPELPSAFSDPVDGAATDEVEFGECVPPPPLDGVHDEAAARSLAADLLGRLGHARIRITSVFVDDWSAWVSAELTEEGVPAESGLMVGVGFGGDGRVTSAHGTTATVEALGAYPTIDAVEALVRLERELSAWLDGGPVARPLPAADAGAADDADGPVDDPDAPVTDTPVTILPTPEVPSEREDIPEPVEVTVTIVAVEPITMMSWSPDGTVLLVPHYRLIDRDGGWWFVVAVADRYLAG